MKSISDLTEVEAREELARLAALLHRANRLYHGEDAPEISDAEYDSLKSETRRSKLGFHI